MVGTLNLYLDPELSYMWQEASLVVSKSQGHGINHARNIHTWIHQFLSQGKLPFHQYSQLWMSILEDEDFLQAIQLHLQAIAKDGYIWAQDIIEFVSQPCNQNLKCLVPRREVYQFEQCNVGYTRWVGGMVKRGMGCTLMDMSKMILWSIVTLLLCGGRATKNEWSHMIRMVMLTTNF